MVTFISWTLQRDAAGSESLTDPIQAIGIPDSGLRGSFDGLAACYPPLTDDTRVGRQNYGDRLE